MRHFEKPPQHLNKKSLPMMITAASMLMIAGCSSGGGGPSGNDGGIHPPPDSPSSPSPSPDGTVSVGVADSGFRDSHEIFDGRIAYKTNIFDDSENVDSEMSHGTMTASVVAETTQRSNLMLAKVNAEGDDSLALTSAILYGVKELAENGADVINVSYGGMQNAPVYAHPDYFPELADLATHRGYQGRDSLKSVITSNNGKGSVYVISAGNDSQAMQKYEAMYEGMPEVNARMLIVGALDNGNLASYSNFPGADVGFQDRFLTAEGTADVATSNSDSSYGMANGTSFSAPLVSAYAAEILHQWPHLDSVATSRLLLDTADKSHPWYGNNTCGDSGTLNCGAYYFGQGEADLEEALKPQGDLEVATGSHLEEGTEPLSTSMMSLSQAFGAVEAEAAGSMAVFDELGRDYQYDLSQGIVAPNDYDNTRREGMSRLSEAGRQQVKKDSITGKGYHFTQTYRGNGDILASRFDASVSGMTLSGFQFSGDHISPLDIRETSGFMPMMAWSGGSDTTDLLGDIQGASMAASFLSPSLTWRLSHWSGESDIETTPYSSQFQDLSVDWDVNRHLGLSLGTSQTDEKGGILGATGSGAMSLGDNNDMRYYHATLSFDLGNGLSGFTTYQTGEGSAEGSGMVSSISDIKTSSMALGLQWQGNGHQLGIAVSQPDLVESATMQLDVPVGRDLDGNVLRENRSFGLSSSGRQRDIELGYHRMAGDDLSWGINLMHTKDPGHDAEADDDVSGVLTISKIF